MRNSMPSNMPPSERGGVQPRAPLAPLLNRRAIWMESIDLDFRDRVLGAVTSPKLEVSATLVKTDLKAEVAVPGAKLAGGSYLVRK